MIVFIATYVPESHLEVVKQAVFEVGAGKIGNYDCCSWQTKGIGQFRPLVGSDPYLGSAGKVETITEWKLEFVCHESLVRKVLEALRKSHPYETPAIHVMATLPSV